MKKLLHLEQDLIGKTIAAVKISDPDAALIFTDDTAVVFHARLYDEEVSQTIGGLRELDHHDLFHLGIMSPEEFAAEKAKRTADYEAREKEQRRKVYEALRKEFGE